jgi:3-hydroxyisobutyrate dehydrogenase-like beta-hydroxyacid dehydrogenase
MGGHMAAALPRRGTKQQPWNRTAAKAEALSAFGVAQACDAAAAAYGADAVICMLRSGPVCDETLGGGVLGAMRPGSLLIVMSSMPVATAQRQAELAAKRGVDYLDAPVSGG